jgi:hypothetical protein
LANIDLRRLRKSEEEAIIGREREGVIKPGEIGSTAKRSISGGLLVLSRTTETLLEVISQATGGNVGWKNFWSLWGTFENNMRVLTPQ